MLTQNFNNILIIKPSAAGDIICALPILPALKKRFPQAKISWLVSSHLSELITNHPLIDHVIEFDRRRFGYLAHSWAVTKRFVKFLRSLRQANYDLVIDLQGLFRSGFLAWNTQAPVRIGPYEKRELGWIFYTHRMPETSYETHAVDRMYSCMKLLSNEDEIDEPKFIIHIPQAQQNAILSKLHARKIEPNRYIAIAPGGTWPSKRWPVEKFIELTKLICSELKLPVIIIGGKHERIIAEKMTDELANYPVANFVGQTTLAQLLAIIDNAKALISNDSGPMHIAVALNKPITAIIGPTNANRTGPYKRPNSVVQANLDCSPCYKKHCPKLKDENSLAPPICMQQIPTEDVFKNLISQLDNNTIKPENAN